MAPRKLTPKEFANKHRMTLPEFVEKYNEYGSIKAVSRHTDGMSYATAMRLCHFAVDAGLMLKPSVGVKKIRDATQAKPLPEEPVVEGKIRVMRTELRPLPKKGTVKRYLLTCAQNNTHINQRVWDNLQALSKHWGAEIMVSRFLYRKGARNDVRGKETLYGAEGDWWDDKLVPYLADSRVEIAPSLVWCGEMNILPTASNPLSAMERYTGRASSIFPHVKRAMESVPSGKHEATKFMYTTGTVTQRNYIQRKAGQKAEFDHCYGALLAEVDSDGNWYCRQLDADGDGTMCDLDTKVRNGKVTTGHRVEGILWGDIHVRWLAPEVRRMAWGADGMMEVLNPKFQFFGDTLDFRSRNHHDIKDPFAMFRRWVEGGESVKEEVMEAMAFVRWAAPTKGCKTIIIDSNHDAAAQRWLKEADWRHDPVNMEFYLASALAKIKAINRGDDNFHLMDHWAKKYMTSTSGIKILRQDESFIICKNSADGIEMGMHGHIGLNGARGSARGYSKMGRRANVGHAHSCRIVNGIYQAGTCSVLDMLYNLGPSSWSWSHVVTYANGQQAIVTMWNNKWRA